MGLLVDLLYAWLDPRVRLRAMSGSRRRCRCAACERIPRRHVRAGYGALGIVVLTLVRPVAQSERQRDARLVARRLAARPAERALVRHRPAGPRSVRAHAGGRARLAGRRAGGERRQPAGRHRLRRGRRLRRRAHRSGDDAHHRDLERPAADFFRHFPDGDLRPQRVSAVPVDRRRRLADHGAHRARPDLEHPPAGIHRGRGGVAEPAPRASSSNT